MQHTCDGCGLQVPPAPEHWTTLPREDTAAFVPSAEQQATLRQLYKPLNGGETRLIRLSAPRDGRLHADLIVVDLRHYEGIDPDSSDSKSAAVSFKALSYVCGSQAPSDFIECNGTKVPITRDLAIALHCIQHHSSEPSYLWVDAICINPHDRHEKARQVIKLLEIFAKADSVIAWLGEADFDALLVFSYLRNLSHARADSTDKEGDGNGGGPSDTQVKALHGTLTRFCERPWFKRLWIRTEIFGAKDITFIVGSTKKETRECIYKSTSRERFLRLEGVLDKIAKCPMHAHLNSQRALTCLEDLRTPDVLAPKDFSDTLVRSRELEVALEADRIHSILGICAVPARDSMPYDSTPDPSFSFSELYLTVDYTRPPTRIFEEATLYILSKPPSIHDLPNLLNFHEVPPGLPPKSLPKWISTFSSSRSPDCILPITSDLTPFIPLPLTPTPVFKYAWPTLSRSPSGTHLRLGIRATNYIAHLTPWTASTASFLRDAGISPTLRAYALSRRGRGIHSSCFPGGIVPPSSSSSPRRKKRRGVERWSESDEQLFSRRPVLPDKFEPAEHSRRIVVLGIGVGGEEEDGEGGGIALAPANARVGDLVVVPVAEGLLPLVISPRRRGEDGAGWRKSVKSGWGIVEARVRGRRSGDLFPPPARKETVVERVGAVIARMKASAGRPRISFREVLWDCIMVGILFEILIGGWLQLVAFISPLSTVAKVCACLSPFMAIPLYYLLRFWYKSVGGGCRRRRLEPGDRLLQTAIRERRDEVRKFLDRVTLTVGDEWEFVGPLLVKHKDGKTRLVKERSVQEIDLY